MNRNCLISTRDLERERELSGWMIEIEEQQENERKKAK